MSDVFISYSRRDIDFVRHLFDQLKARDRDAWADWQYIPPTADWLAELYCGIGSIDSFMIIISLAFHNLRNLYLRDWFSCMYTLSNFQLEFPIFQV